MYLSEDDPATLIVLGLDLASAASRAALGGNIPHLRGEALRRVHDFHLQERHEKLSNHFKGELLGYGPAVRMLFFCLPAVPGCHARIKRCLS
jgi:hypothetical protein